MALAGGSDGEGGMMAYLDELTDEQRRRLEQIEVYHKNFGYDEDSQDALLWKLYEIIKTVDFVDEKRLERLPWWKKQIRKNAENNPYTCRLLRRVDYLIYRLKGHRPYWSSSGRLCEGHWELTSHFPQWLYGKASELQNHWVWTRLVLSA
jgi:hypothetical protein